MINKIRKYFGLREKIKIDDVTIFLPIQFSVGLTGIEFPVQTFHLFFSVLAFGSVFKIGRFHS